MTVAELRAALMDLPDDMLVILAKDAEGNGFSPLASLGTARYEADTTWSGEIHGNLSDYGEPCVVLDPVN